MNCPNCGAVITGGEKFCSNCGRPASPIPASQRVLVCPKCETKNSPDSTVCAVCGETLPIIQEPLRENTASQQIYCKKCGMPNPVSNRHCSRCGMAFFGTDMKSAEKNTEKTLNNIIIVLIVAAVVTCGIALCIFFGGSWFVSSSNIDDNTKATETITPTEEPTESPTPIPTPLPTLAPTVAPTYNPYVSYYMHRDSTYSMNCPYPSGFMSVTPLSNFTRLSLVANDGSGKIHLCATTNDNNRDAQTVSKNFKNSYDYNSVVYEDCTSNSCSTLITNGSKYNYCYYNLSGGKIRGFELECSASAYTRYMEYAEYMRYNLELY